jgi:hypothetical protein
MKLRIAGIARINQIKNEKNATDKVETGDLEVKAGNQAEAGEIVRWLKLKLHILIWG